MSQSFFEYFIKNHIKKAGIDAPVYFDFDPDRIMFFAYIPSEEIRAFGRPGTTMVSFRTGNGRTFMVDATAC